MASIAPIDETQLFYLETRGISQQSAENLLVAAFLEDVLGRVPLKPLAKHLAKVIEEKCRVGAGSSNPQRPDLSTISTTFRTIVRPPASNEGAPPFFGPQRNPVSLRRSWGSRGSNTFVHLYAEPLSICPQILR